MTAKKSALEAEATESTTRTFTYQGREFTVEGNVEKWDLEVMEAYEDSKSVTVVRALVGPEQWRKFTALKPTNKDFAEFSDKLFAAIGTSEGESED